MGDRGLDLMNLCTGSPEFSSFSSGSWIESDWEHAGLGSLKRIAEIWESFVQNGRQHQGRTNNGEDVHVWSLN